jgi:multidrug efflux pump subunit AcrA (membrane-fusion protein)
MRRVTQTRALDVLLAALVLLVLWAIYAVAGPESQRPPATTVVERGTVVSTVSADGNVEPPQDLSLGFERGGRIVEIRVREGDRVRRGEILARVGNLSERAQLAAAQRDVESARARLADTRAGETIAELDENRRRADQSRVAVRNAQRQVANARNTSRADVRALRRAVARAQVSGEEADLRTSELRLAQEQAEVRRLEVEHLQDEAETERLRTELESLYDDLAAARSDGDDDEAHEIEADVNAAQTRLSGSEREESTAKSDLDTARANVRSYVQDVEGDRVALREARRALGDAEDNLDQGIAEAQEQVDAARRSLADSEAELRLTLASVRVDEQGPEAAELAADRAGVAQALASLEDAHEAVEDTILRAPADGIVGKVEAEVGEVVGSDTSLRTGRTGAADADSGATAARGGTGAGSAGAASGGVGGGEVVRLAVEQVQVRANFNETDAARLRRGDTATISVDALPDRRFPARVSAIQPVETVIDNVVTYEVTMVLDRGQAGLKPGMTASAEVIADEADGVLTLPRSAVRSPAGANPTVTILRPDGTREARLVVTGLEGDTTVEILGGVGLGDRVVRTAGAGSPEA